MPEQSCQDKPCCEEPKAADSGTESESDDSIPELEDTGAGGAGEGVGTNPVAAAAGLNEELVSKAKQSRGEKKARKIMSKLGLRQVLFLKLYRQNIVKHIAYFSLRQNFILKFIFKLIVFRLLELHV